MFSIRGPVAMLGLASVVTLGAGCGTDEADSATAPTTETTATTADPTTDPPADVGLVSDPNDGSISCVSKVTEGGRVSLYDPTVLAHGDVTIVDAKVVGDGVRLLDEESVVSLAPVTNGPGALVDDEWPMTLARTRAGSVDKESRQPLVGSVVGDGTRILPLLSFAVTKPGRARADALVLTYRADGDPAKRTERVQLGITLTAGTCR
ncbi:MAG: hypothetical protein ACXWDM_02650 [Nocardioides sp.]